MAKPSDEVVLSMPSLALKDAKNKVMEITPKLDEHIVKLIMFGDRKGWRNEIFAWCNTIYNIKLKLPTRKRLTTEEYMDCLQEFDPTEHVNFQNWVEAIEENLDPKMERKLSLEEARYKVHDIQRKLAGMWSSGTYTKPAFEYYLNSVLYKEI